MLFLQPRAPQKPGFAGVRLSWPAGGQAGIEHLHRYAFARSRCRGLDVLDVACGEGDGAAMLAQAARSVIGVDRDPVAVARAQRNFARRSLGFVVGDAMALPLADGSVDVVVSFETIEQLHGHDAFLGEVRRVLRPGGLLIASSPDRDFHAAGAISGPLHVRELNRAEFTGLLNRHFVHVAVALQRPLAGSALVPDGGTAREAPMVFERRGKDVLRVTAGLSQAGHVVGVASDRPVDHPASLYIESSDLDGPAARVQDARVAVLAAQAETRRLDHDLDASGAALAASMTLRNGLQASLEHSEDARRQAEAARRQAEAALAEAALVHSEELRRRQEAALAHGEEQRQQNTAALAARQKAVETLEARLALASRALDHATREAASAEQRLHALETSTLWKATWPVRRLARRSPGASRHMRRAMQVMWWTATLQLHRRWGLWRQAQAIRRTVVGMQVPRLPETLPAPVSITIPAHARPAVSIVIPTYGKVDFTLQCLASIGRGTTATAFEVIVAEDASGDPDMALLRQVANIRLIEHPRNLGFLHSCNAAAAAAQGRFVLFLNNDTQVLPGWLDALVELMDARPDAGAVGAKLLFPDGRLQEAGGIIWQDGSGWNYGRFDDPRRPVYNYVREADYISGAALMVRTSVLRQLGGFDPHFAPAYCEDSDLAFRIRALGLKVLYQPRSEVVHFEGVSHGTDTGQGVKAYQVGNQAKLMERWGDVLMRDHLPSGTHVLRARDRARHRRVVLVIDHYVPQPDRDAGSRTMVGFMTALLHAGMVVKLWPDNGAYSPGYTEALQELGIEVCHSAGSFDDWVGQHGANLDSVLLSRPGVAEKYIGVLRDRTPARLTFYGHDLHFARLALQAVAGDPAAAATTMREADESRQLERSVWQLVDTVLYPSQEEADIVAAMEPGVTVRAVAPYAFDDFAQPRAAVAGADILFVAGFAHPPNEDAALWFVAEILPLIRAAMPSARLLVVGSNPTAKVRALAGETVPGGTVTVHANVSDAELRDFYGGARVTVVPLRYGAGVKLKVAEALREGVPLVTTPVGAQGCPLLPGIVAVHQSPVEFAAAAVRLLTDDAHWERCCADQIAYARERFSPQAMRLALLAAI